MGAQETSLTKKIEKWWEQKGTYVLKFHGNNFSQQGVSDLIMCYKGRFIALEVKVKDNKPTPLQLEHIRRVNEWYGGTANWVNENNWLEISEKIVREIDDEKNI